MLCVAACMFAFAWLLFVCLCCWSLVVCGSCVSSLLMPCFADILLLLCFVTFSSRLLRFCVACLVLLVSLRFWTCVVVLLRGGVCRVCFVGL